MGSRPATCPPALEHRWCWCTAPATDYAPARLARFMDAVGLGRAAVAGNSLGGLAALQLAPSKPERITALCLVDSAGLGRAVNPALVVQRFPGIGSWRSPSAGVAQEPPCGRGARAVLLFRHPWRAPRAWLVEQYQAARQPGFLEATLASLRAVLGPFGQRQVLVKQLPGLTVPTLVVWGTADRVIPVSHGRRTARRLASGRLVQLSRCGHALQAPAAPPPKALRTPHNPSSPSGWFCRACAGPS